MIIEYLHNIKKENSIINHNIKFKTIVRMIPLYRINYSYEFLSAKMDRQPQ